MFITRAQWYGSPPRGWERWKVGHIIGLVGRIDVLEQDLPLSEEDSVGAEEPVEGTVEEIETTEQSEAPERGALKLSMSGPEPVGLDGRGSGLIPEYQYSGVDDRQMRGLISAAFEALYGLIQEPLPKDILEKNKLYRFDDALRDAHFPSNTAFKGEQRLSFDEIFFHQISRRLSLDKRQCQASQISVVHDAIGKLQLLKGMVLDDEQEIVFSNVRRDLRRSRPMRRLLQGDVGSGKSTVTLLSAVLAADSGSIVLYITPDNLSAERRFLFAEPLLREVGINTKLIHDQPSKAEEDLFRRGYSGVVFGSKKLLQQTAIWKKVGLVVSEEAIGGSNSLGSTVKTPLFQQPHVPHLMISTPTPLPSLLVETLYVNFSLSVISSSLSLPTTVLYTAEARDDAYASAEEELAAGRQGYIILPQREGKDIVSLPEALSMAKGIRERYFPSARIGVYCSDMGKDERLRLFDDFQSRRIDLLLCAAAIEDAPKVGNASVMLLEYADNYSLQRVRRLQGHISTAHYPACCRLILGPNPKQQAIEQLQLASSISSGFQLADRELELSTETFQDSEVFKNAPRYIWGGVSREQRVQARKEAHRIDIRDIRKRRWPTLNQALSAWTGREDVAPRHKKKRRRRR